MRRDPAALAAFAGALFRAAGLDGDKAEATGRILVLTDMMGRRTHGLAQCGNYLAEIAKGGMTPDGAPEVLRDTGATVVWDGGYRPGLWLVEQAMALGFQRLPAHGTFTLAMRRSHHIGCLAALAKQATDRGLFVMLASSGPHSRIVAPFGGRKALFSPNPFAVGFPTGAAPVLVDISASITTVSMTRQKAAAGEQFDHPWLLDRDGRPTRDPTAMEAGGGSLMLLGGEEAGHKGFGLALMVEALTQGLAGHGRRDDPGRWGASVYLQLIDPAAFAGREAFEDQMGFLAEACRSNDPIDPARPVRLPGEQATRLIAAAERDGLEVPDTVAASLRDWAGRLGVAAAI
ncbi:Ldh family oxidoreductase [Roseomonas haemaphysalidis]|uniref:Ldh family oxidoreductase n=1 Tax=Roseomonas haemaphysalidis TaxID=2768162 RepID=A0ABS3KUS1_9PROT|nr:Ldh family oxidoreductase [Roseomonas haemaphysalidis]MBO1080690.1 Ldh family oxidoreductase [Roseomonas haemaphysalidis]